MRLAGYLERIGYDGPVAADLACLTAIHRRHLLAIPYENLDVQLREPLDLDPARIYDKLVVRRRGGWCYEMNGLLGWALAEIGFRVTRMVGGVLRAVHGDAALGNHLVLRVDLGEPWVADVGLGDGVLEPLPLRAGGYAQAGRRYRLEPVDGGLWRFHNHADTIPPSFDFALAPDDPLLAATCRQLQDDEESLFRQHLICLQPDGRGGTRKLLGRVLDLPGREKRVLPDAAALRDALERHFGLSVPGVESLWPQLVARHAALFGGAEAAPGGESGRSD